MDSLPRILQGYAWIHAPTGPEDKFAGVSIGYKHWMPKPEDLMERFWSNKEQYGKVSKQKNLELLKGRLAIAGINMEHKSIIIANFYGFAKEEQFKNTIDQEQQRKQAHELIITATQLCLQIAKAWVEDKKIPAEKMMLLFAGDFNATPETIRRQNWSHDHPTESFKGASLQTTKNKDTAMDKIEDNFLHTMELYGERTSYKTYRAFDGKNIKYESGIDHMYLLKQTVDKEKTWIPPKATFWHGYEKKPNPESRHDLLGLKIDRVWSCAIKRDATKVKSPYAKIPIWAYAHEPTMEKAANEIRKALDRVIKDKTKTISSYDKLMTDGLPRIFNKLIKNQKKAQASIKHTKKPHLVDMLKEVEKAENEAQDNKQFNDTCIAGVLEEQTVFTERHTVKEKIHQLFTSKFKRKTHIPWKRQKEVTKEWLKHTPEAMKKEDADQLEHCLTEQAIKKAIKQMKAEAAPGLDGQALALYTNHHTGDLMIQLLAKVAEYAIMTGRLPESMGTSVIRLLQKEGRNNVDIKSGKRPVTLMNISVRIISKVISDELRPQMMKWIAKDQRAYVKNRRIEVNTATIAILIQRCLENDEGEKDNYIEELERLIRIETDFASAFDTISHDFLRALLKEIGMGDRMIAIIMLIVSSMSAKVIVNDELTEEIRIRVGVPQGCSLSGLLFILVLECMFRRALSNPETYGNGVPLVKGSKDRTLYSAFADDCDIWVTEIRHVINWFELLGKFEEATGLALQPPKCKANMLGGKWVCEKSGSPSRHGKKALEELKKKLPKLMVGFRADIKSVGITLSMEEATKPKGNLTEKTWNTKLKKLTPYVKAISMKTAKKSIVSKARKVNEVLSRLWYIVLNCIPNDQHIKTVNSLVNRLLWNRESYPVPRNEYIQPMGERNGLGAPDAKTRMEAIISMWIPMYLQGKLPTSLEEYMREVCTRIGKALGAPSIETQDTLWQGLMKIAHTWRKAEAKDKLKHMKSLKVGRAYQPMVKAVMYTVDMIAAEAEDDISEEEVKAWSVKGIYKARLKKNEPLQTTESSGQRKWSEENKELNDNDWKYTWKLAKRCIQSKEDDLHDGLYKMIRRKLVIPQQSPVECTLCTDKEEWNTKHAVLECKEIQDAWKEALGITARRITAKDIFNLDMHGKEEEKVFSTKKNKKGMKKPTLSPKEIRGLSALKEIINETEERAKKNRKETKVENGQRSGNLDQTQPQKTTADDNRGGSGKVKEWMEVIGRREREVIKRQQRRKEKLEGREETKEEKSGIG